MSFRKLLRTPLSLGAAFLAVAALCLKKQLGNDVPFLRTNQHKPPAKKGQVYTHNLAKLSRHLLIKAEEEKARFARDLHDGLGSSITAVNIDLFWIKQRLADQPVVAARLVRAMEVLASTVEMKRRIIHELRPTALDNLGLGLAIESHIGDYSKSFPVAVELDLQEEIPAMHTHASIAMFRIFQEALQNATHHAGATAIKISLHEENSCVILRITDNGTGIDMHIWERNPAPIGLLTMRERAAAVGGAFGLEHGENGRGTVVTVTLPYQNLKTPAVDTGAAASGAVV